MKWIEAKLKMLGVSSNPEYKICFYLDADAMISVHTPKYGVVEVSKQSLWGIEKLICRHGTCQRFLEFPRLGNQISGVKIIFPRKKKKPQNVFFLLERSFLKWFAHILKRNGVENGGA